MSRCKSSWFTVKIIFCRRKSWLFLCWRETWPRYVLYRFYLSFILQRQHMGEKHFLPFTYSCYSKYHANINRSVKPKLHTESFHSMCTIYCNSTVSLCFCFLYAFWQRGQLCIRLNYSLHCLLATTIHVRQFTVNIIEINCMYICTWILLLSNVEKKHM